jgi:hypothetical protein
MKGKSCTFAWVLNLFLSLRTLFVGCLICIFSFSYRPMHFLCDKYRPNDTNKNALVDREFSFCAAEAQTCDSNL